MKNILGSALISLDDTVLKGQSGSVLWLQPSQKGIIQQTLGEVWVLIKVVPGRHKESNILKTLGSDRYQKPDLKQGGTEMVNRHDT